MIKNLKESARFSIKDSPFLIITLSLQKTNTGVKKINYFLSNKLFIESILFSKSFINSLSLITDCFSSLKFEVRTWQVHLVCLELNSFLQFFYVSELL